MVDIKGLDKAEVLHALWHASHTQGLSFLGFKGNFTIERARELINSREDRREKDQYRLYFDYVDGHVIKCNLTGDAFDERLFDRDCGEGAAAKAIEKLRNGEVTINHDHKNLNLEKMFKEMRKTIEENQEQ